MNILEVKDLCKSFGKSEIIKGLSFSLQEGEILGILGPNGAGKTTTLQMLLGILTPTSGSIQVLGHHLPRDKSAIMEQVNFSSTYTDLPWRLTVCENLTWTAWLYAIEDRKARLDKIKSIFRLGKLWHQSFGSLSAGQRTRVNLARSMVNFPRLLLLDEPTASLDPEVASYIREFFASQRKRFGTSIILTSHNMAEVEELCDRVLILRSGVVIGNDTPQRLATRVSHSRLNLRVVSGTKQLASLVAKQGLNMSLERGITTITLLESLLPSFLTSLTKHKVRYSEISIDKPSLEDYFLSVVRGESNEII